MAMLKYVHSIAVLALISMVSAAWGVPSTQPSRTASNRTAPAAKQPAVVPSIQAFFSPDGGCTEAIVEQLTAAKRSIDVQAYSFTSAPIAKAIVAAHKRGIVIRVVLDKSQKTAKYTSATFLYNSGVATFIDSKHAIAHNKIIIIDGETLLTGSFNFSAAAEERNAENLLVIKGYPNLVTEYLANFEEHLEHSKPYEGRDEDESK